MKKEITYLPISRLHPHPDNPRKDLGDLTELADSIRENGIFQNLTVVDDDPSAYGSEYTVIIGHRRLAAAKLVGLTEVPCAIVEMTPAEQVQTMLLENMQRSDLTVYEQAQGFQMMLDFGYSVAEISEKTGLSQTTVRRRVKMTELDQQKLREVSDRQIALEDFDVLARIEDIDTRNEVLGYIGTRDFDYNASKAIKAQNVARNLPAVEAWLKNAKARKITAAESWSNKYERFGRPIFLARWGEDGEKPPQEYPQPLFYLLDSDTLRLFGRTERAKPEKKTEEQIAREKAVEAAWKHLEETAAAAYDTRKSFAATLSVSRRNLEKVLRGALAAALLDTVEYNSADRDALHALLGMSGKTWGEERQREFLRGLKTLKDEDLGTAVYAMFGDNAQIPCTGYGGRKAFPKYEWPLKLAVLYGWLETMGYPISTAEERFITGEDDAWHAWERFENKGDGENA